MAGHFSRLLPERLFSARLFAPRLFGGGPTTVIDIGQWVTVPLPARDRRTIPSEQQRTVAPFIKDLREADVFELRFKRVLGPTETISTFTVAVMKERNQAWTDVTSSYVLATARAADHRTIRIRTQSSQLGAPQAFGRYVFQVGITTSAGRTYTATIPLIVVGPE
jgi:hypothetical protein